MRPVALLSDKAHRKQETLEEDVGDAGSDPCRPPRPTWDRTGRFSRWIFPSLEHRSAPRRAAGCRGTTAGPGGMHGRKRSQDGDQDGFHSPDKILSFPAGRVHGARDRGTRNM